MNNIRPSHTDAGPSELEVSPPWVVLARSRAARRRQRRQQARERIHARVVHPIDAPHQLRDPLERHVTHLSSALSAARLLLLAVALHGLMLGVVFAANQLIGGSRAYHPSERVQLRIVEPPPAPEPPPQPEPAAPAPEPEFQEVRPEPKPPPAPPKPKPEEVARPEPEPAPAEPPPETPEAAPPPPRVVGLSLESTVVASGGPAFAIGTTRMGQTARQAVAPERASQATGTQPTSASSGSTAATGNRVATRLPVGDAPIVRPKPVSKPEPAYPPLLRAQGVEGDVVLLATIDERGRVADVEIVRPSSHPEFDEAALAAARRARYTPATRGGKPFVFSQRYTVRFRIHD